MAIRSCSMRPTIVERRYRAILKLLERYPDRWSDTTLAIALRLRAPINSARLKAFLDRWESALHRLTIGN